MPTRATVKKAKQELRRGKSPTTAAGEFVHEEIEHVREGKHGARSSKQAIAIGLSKARRAGVALPPPERGKKSTRQQAARDVRKGRTQRGRKPSPTRARATRAALKKEGRRAASRTALSRQARGSRSTPRRSSRGRKK